MNKPEEPLNPIKISTLLDRYNIRPKKGLSQNFLVDEYSLQKIVTAGSITKQDLVLEVGPGLGSLTRHLARKAGYVIAVEIDSRLIPSLSQVLRSFSNVRIIQGDILNCEITKTLTAVQVTGKYPGYAVIANIPYNITSALIRHLLEAEVKPDRIVLTLQKEVAMRICSHPPDLSILALSVQVYGEPRIVADIPAASFYPIPKVDSAVLHLSLYPQPLIPTSHLETFFRLVKAGFSQKRKTLRNSLSAGLNLPKQEIETLLLKNKIDPNRRAQTLAIEEWKDLTIAFKHQ
jgi:16S rRNA (adenine1518-N6/adenine1519-N6)-dimethyltransferase